MSWPWHRLGDLLLSQPNRKLLQQGWSPQCYPHPAPDGAWGVLKTTAIQDGRFEPEHNKELPSELVPREKIEVHPGDLLMTCAGPRARCGVAALVRNTRPRLMMSGKMYRFRPDERVLPSFLELWLRSPEAQRRIDAMKTGISESGLNLTHDRFIELDVPVPPIAEQQLLVDTLEDQLSRLDAADAYLAAAATHARQFHASVIDRLVWSSSSQMREVRSLLRERMRNGRSDRAVRDSYEGTRTLTLTAITESRFVDENTKLTTTSSDRAKGLWLETGDIFVQRSNTPELVGTSARYDGPPDWAIFPDLLIRLRVDETVVDSRFLVAALRSMRGHAQMRDRAKGAAGSMPKIDQDAIGSVAIPLPTPSDQVGIIEQVREADDRLRRLESEVGSSRRRSGVLRRTVVEAAFAERLTVGKRDMDLSQTRGG